MANEALGEGKCVVIGLQSTGDSRTKQMVQRRAEEDEEDEALRFVPGLIYSPREVLLQLLDHAFPEILLPEAQPAVTTEEGDPSLFNPRRVGTGL
mgnify:FL=1